jgi:hypothetical protein
VSDLGHGDGVEATSTRTMKTKYRGWRGRSKTQA